MKRDPVNLPLFIAQLAAAVLLWILSRDPLPAGVLAAVGFVSIWGPRVSSDRLGQIALGAVLLFGAVMVELVVKTTASAGGPNIIGPLSRAAAIGFLAVAASRGMPTPPTRRRPS